MNIENVLSSENTSHLSVAEKERLKTTAVQVAWAEHACEELKKQGIEMDPVDWMISHGQWFRDNIIEDPERHELIDRFSDPKESERVILEIKSIYVDHKEATKH